MSDLFLRILNLSITASWLILAVVIIRPLMKKAPKWINCALWGLVALRLVCPVSLACPISLIPNSETIPKNIAMDRTPQIDTGVQAVNALINPIIERNFTPDPIASANPLQILIPFLAIVWIAGIVAMAVYALISYLRLKKSVGVTLPIESNVFACDEVKSPFVLGVVRPKIYVPSSMAGDALEYVITHEKTHIKRGDHFWKPLGFVILAVYWFNPLCWIAYVLLCRDIELACDEKVIRDLDKEGKAGYSEALLSCSFPRRRIAACPLAFGEVGVKERVKGVLNYKKPALLIVCASVIVFAIIAVCFLTNPKEKGSVITFGTYEKNELDSDKDSMLYQSVLTINEDGTFAYSPSVISSYMGTGTWNREGELITFNDVGMGDNRKEVFRLVDGNLYYMADQSASDSMWELEDGAEYVLKFEYSKKAHFDLELGYCEKIAKMLGIKADNVSVCFNYNGAKYDSATIVVQGLATPVDASKQEEIIEYVADSTGISADMITFLSE